jgi:hypothetical protein
MANRFVNRKTLDGGNSRVTVTIPENDRRLISWPRYMYQKTGRDFAFHAENRKADNYETVKQEAISFNKEMSRFFVYFGSIGSDRIRGVRRPVVELANAA